MASNCTLGIQNLVKTTLNNKPWFEYDQSLGIVNILDSFAKKINKENSHGVAKTTAITINKQINDGYKNIGDIAFVKSNKEGRGYIDIAPSINQIYLINAQNAKEINELQKQLDEEELLKGFYQTRETGNYDVVDGEIVPFFGNEANLIRFSALRQELRVQEGKLNFKNGKINDFDILSENSVINKEVSQQQAQTIFNKKNKTTQDKKDLSIYFANYFLNSVYDKEGLLHLGYTRFLRYGITPPKLLIVKDNGRKNPFFQYNNVVIIGLDQIEDLLNNVETASFEKFENLINTVAQEEIIHLYADYILDHQDIDNIYNEMTEKDIEQIKKIYGNSSIQKENIVHEYVRMVVQQRVFGKTTEYETFTLSNELMLFFEKLLERLNDFLSTIIGSTNTQKAIEDVINFTKGNFSEELDEKIINRVFNKGQILETNLNVLNNFQEEQKELDEIVEDINNTNQDIKYQLSKEQLDAIDNVFDENPELADVVYSALKFGKESVIKLNPYATDVWGKVPKQRGGDNFVNKEQYSVKINTENRGIDVRLTIYFDDSNKTAFVSNIENFENDVTHPLKKGLGLKAFLEANKLIIEKGYTPTIDNLVSGYGYDMMLKLEKQGYLLKVLNKNVSDSQYDNVKYENPPFIFTNKIYETQITPQQTQQAKEVYQQYINSLLTGETISNQAGDLSKSSVKDVVYHGSNIDFTKQSFKRDWIGNFKGIYFYDKKEGQFGTNKFDTPALLNITKAETSYDKLQELIKNNEKFALTLWKLGTNALSSEVGKVYHGSYLMVESNTGSRDGIKYYERVNNNWEEISNEVAENLIAKNSIDGDGIIIKGTKGINQAVVFEPEQIHILGGKSDIEQAKEFISNNNNQKTEDYFSNEINKIQEESKIIENSLKEYETSKKIDNRNTTKAIKNKEEKTKETNNKLLSLGFEFINENEYQFSTSSYITFKSKLNSLEGIDVSINTFKSPDYLIKIKIAPLKNNFDLQKQGELPFNPIELKLALKENDFIQDIADNTFEGLTEEQIKILRDNLENGELNLNCKI